MPEVIFRHIDDVPQVEVKAQQHGDRRASIRLRFMEQAANRVVIHTRYDPGIVVEPHGHASDHVIFVLDGSLTVGEVACAPGMLIVLEHGATFGPLVAGPHGATLLEFYTGDPRPEPVDEAAFAAYLAERGIRPVPVPGFGRPSAD